MKTIYVGCSERKRSKSGPIFDSFGRVVHKACEVKELDDISVALACCRSERYGTFTTMLPPCVTRGDYRIVFHDAPEFYDLKNKNFDYVINNDHYFYDEDKDEPHWISSLDPSYVFNNRRFSKQLQISRLMSALENDTTHVEPVICVITIPDRRPFAYEHRNYPAGFDRKEGWTSTHVVIKDEVGAMGRSQIYLPIRAYRSFMDAVAAGVRIGDIELELDCWTYPVPGYDDDETRGIISSNPHIVQNVVPNIFAEFRVIRSGAYVKTLQRGVSHDRDVPKVDNDEPVAENSAELQAFMKEYPAERIIRIADKLELICGSFDYYAFKDDAGNVRYGIHEYCPQFGMAYLTDDETRRIREGVCNEIVDRIIANEKRKRTIDTESRPSLRGIIESTLLINKELQ